MPRQVYEGFTNVYWVTSIANKNAPTVAEITAGTNLTTFVPKDGVAVNINTNNVDNGDISSQFDPETVGSWGSGLEITFFRDNTADTAWNLCVINTNGFIVIDRFRASGTLPVATNKVEVYPVQMHQPAMMNSAANTNKKFVEKFAVTSAPALSATVA